MERNELVEQLRMAADQLENAEDTTILPGWDGNADIARRNVIRDAAKAVSADKLTYDEGTQVPVWKLGMLVRYIADMLEE